MRGRVDPREDSRTHLDPGQRLPAGVEVQAAGLPAVDRRQQRVAVDGEVRPPEPHLRRRLGPERASRAAADRQGCQKQSQTQDSPAHGSAIKRKARCGGLAA